MRRRQSLASKIEFLDPADCGSTVGYVIVRSRHGLSGEVTLSDCNRKIEWYFSPRNALAVQKIDRAVAILTEFRDQFTRAIKRSKRKRK